MDGGPANETDIRTAKRITSTQGGNKRLIIFGTSIILVAAVVTLIVVIVAPSNEVVDRCQVIRKAAAEGKDFSDEFDIAELNSCEDYGCIFDVRNCEIDCPLGYETDENRCEISCECGTDSKGTFQGDIQFDDTEVNDLLMRYGYASVQETIQLFSSSVRESTTLWPTKVDGRVQIPYEIDETVDDAVSVIEEAISAFKKETCIDFVPRKGEKEHVFFASGIGCWSRIGMHEMTPVALGKMCKSPGIIMHELMHVVGFDHEHVRPDRDAFIDVDISRVFELYVRNYDKIRAPVRELGRPYDLASVLQYSSYAWATDPEENVFVTIDKEPVKGQRKYLSVEDIKEINTLYECSGAITEEAISGLNVLTATPPVEEAPVAPGDPTKPPKTTLPTTTTKPTVASTQSSGVYWNEWGSWSYCMKTCGWSESVRFRGCEQQEGIPGEGCEGTWYEFRPCEKEECPGKTGDWGEWGAWGECSKTCDVGYRFRTRICPHEGEPCYGWGIVGSYCSEQLPQCNMG